MMRRKFEWFSFMTCRRDLGILTLIRMHSYILDLIIPEYSAENSLSVLLYVTFVAAICMNETM